MKPPHRLAERTLGYGWAVLFGLGALVSWFFVLVAVLGPIMARQRDPFVWGEPKTNWWTGLALILFFAPMATLFTRATWLVVRQQRGAPHRPLLTPSVAWAIALTYGGTGLIAVVIVAIKDPVNLVESLGIVPMLMLLLSAPLIARRREVARGPTSEQP